MRRREFRPPILPGLVLLQLLRLLQKVVSACLSGGTREGRKTLGGGGNFPTLLPQALALGALSFGGASLLGRAGLQIFAGA